jgi:predicted AAA+ superfamily ATPase
LQAALTAQEINNAQRGRELGVAMTTAQKWSSHLINTYLWHEVNSYSGNTVKRIAKKSKGYLNDTGLACHLMRISSSEALLGHPSLGALFETFCVNQIKTLANTFSTAPYLYHWRTNGGAEVDLILERDNQLFPIEFKCKTILTKRDTQGLQAFRKTYGDHQTIMPGLVVYAGDCFMALSESVYALPWHWVIRKN